MKNYFDLNLLNDELSAKSRAIGFYKTFNLKQRVVEGTISSIIKQCKQNKDVDFINPLLDGDFYKSDALIETAREKGKSFEIPLVFLLRSKNRSKLFFQLRIFLKKCLNRRVSFYFSTRAENEFHLKSPREIIAIAQCLGLNYEQAARALQLGEF